MLSRSRKAKRTADIRKFGAFLCLAAALLASAPPPEQRLFTGATQLQYELDRLAAGGGVLMVGAHPDDEVNSLLAYFARHLRVRTAYLSLTRGEGGQNRIGPEQGNLLGTIREYESYAAGGIDGAERFFTSAVDFGYSKSPAEVWRFWDREKVLREMAGIIRRFRPAAILSVWSGTSADGHGQHQAAGILTREAAAVAADAARFPEAGPAWRVERILDTPRSENGALPIETGRLDVLLGYSPSELGSMSRGMHHSQGMGEPVAYAGDTAYLQGDLRALKLDQARGLRNRPGLIGRLFASRKSTGRTDRVDEAIALAAGLWFDARAAKREFAAGEPWSVSLQAVSRAGLPCTFEARSDGWIPVGVKPVSIRLPAASAAPAAVKFRARLKEGTIEVVRPIVYRYTDAVLGERTAPPVILPAVTLAFDGETYLFPDERQSPHRAPRPRIAR